MSDELSLPAGCILRRASAKDIWSIRKLVLRAKLDPTQLRWQQFWVIECDEHLVACGQLRNFSSAQELGSLVVAPAWRRRGLGTCLTKHLIQEASEPLYLECLGERLAEFYTRFGFVPISWQELPKSLKFKFGLSQLGKTLFRIPVVIMEYLPE
ncbi:MAG: GNAT family N-acetyltransferase [Xenococcaceae cyanobacterium]